MAVLPIPAAVPGFSIAEIEAKLKNVVFLTGEQTITGRKNFSTPEGAEAMTIARATPAPAAVGKNSGELITFTFPAGGEGTAGAGGNSASLIFRLGPGGKSTTEGATTAKGGFAGKIQFGASGFGAGGEAIAKGTAGAFGGKGAITEGRSGPGGKATAEGAGAAIAGGAGNFGFVAEAGGEAVNTSTGNATGGLGGEVLVTAGPGGRAKISGGGGGIAKGGDGGGVKLAAGSAGEAEGGGTNTEGKGGPAILAGGGALSAANAGPVELRTGTAPIVRLLISGEGLTTIKNGATIEGALKAEGTVAVKETLKVTGLTTTIGGLTVEGVLTLPGESIIEAAIKKEAVSEGKLAKPVVEKLLTVAAPTALAAYTSAKEETEAKPTFITLIVKTKAEAAKAVVKLLNSALEQTYEWDALAAGAQLLQLTFVVKKEGKWKATLSGAAESSQVSRVTLI